MNKGSTACVLFFFPSRTEFTLTKRAVTLNLFLLEKNFGYIKFAFTFGTGNIFDIPGHDGLLSYSVSERS